MGEAANVLFQLLDLQLSGSMHSNNHDVVESRDIIQSPMKIQTSDSIINVYKDQVDTDTLGLFDMGSPDVRGFEGIARWQNYRNHWPIARQGNYVFWGFDAPAAMISESGKYLITNILSNHKAQPWTPLSKIQKI